MIDEASIQYNGKAQAAISSPIAVAVKRSGYGSRLFPGVRSNRMHERERKREHKRDDRQRRPVAEPQILQQCGERI